jgi:hypothetical protein
MRRFGYGVMVSILVGCNTQIAVTGAAREEILNRPPLGARWVKDGMTRESRLVDWVACGGGGNLQDGFRDWMDPESRKSYFDGWDQHMSHLSTCMQSKGYIFRNLQKPGLPDQCDASCLYP